MATFSSRLATAVRAKKNAVCVGLDPRWAQLPGALRQQRVETGATRAVIYRKFCFEIIDVVASLVPCVKPQAAFFEALGPQGMVALYEVIKYAHEKGLLVLLDGKRNDIGSTAEAYAESYLGAGDKSAWGSDALTVSPYLGSDSLEPFLVRCDAEQAGIFVLVKTSNPGSGFLQDLKIDEQTIAEKVADWVQAEAAKRVDESGYGSVGAVVGATYPEELAEMRARMPNSWILIPGYGAQGGAASDVAAGFDAQGLGAIVNSSRGIIFAYDSKKYAKVDKWQGAVEAATKEMIQALQADTPVGKL
ncbi:MAG: orotidine-5'-phosphate decarboxylase [Pirellulales bacterium]